MTPQLMFFALMMPEYAKCMNAPHDSRTSHVNYDIVWCMQWRHHSNSNGTWTKWFVFLCWLRIWSWFSDFDWCHAVAANTIPILSETVRTTTCVNCYPLYSTGILAYSVLRFDSLFCSSRLLLARYLQLWGLFIQESV